MSQCVMCNHERAVMWTIEFKLGKFTTTRQVCNRCELAYRQERSKRAA